MNDIEKLRALETLCNNLKSFYFKDYTIGGDTFRTFSYQFIDNYQDWLHPMATSARGHTFLINNNMVKLVCNPMDKFFEFGENPLARWEITDTFWSECQVFEKHDGSLISTVWNPTGKLLLKSKTSFTSDQAVAATKWLSLPENTELFHFVQRKVRADKTVNFEWVAPDNQIVVRYSQPELKILNIRCNTTGAYEPFENALPVINPETEVKDLTNFEGYVCHHPVHGFFKMKSDWYKHLHKMKDNLTHMRIYETVLIGDVNELLDLFQSDPAATELILSVQAKALDDFDEAEITLQEFHERCQHLDRKEYAERALKDLHSSGLFSCAMCLYSGKNVPMHKTLLKRESERVKS